MAKRQQFEMGAKVRDKVTGYEGTITAEHKYISGCVQYSLTRLGKDDKVEYEVFDEQRLELVDKPKRIRQHRAGADHPAPFAPRH